MDAADDVADLLGFALLVAGGPQRVIEDDDTLGAAHLFYQRLAFRVVDPPDLGVVEEIGHPTRVIRKPEALALEHKAVGERPAVVDRHAVRLAAAAGALVAPARLGDIGDELVGTAGEVEEARLDRCGVIQLGDLNHDWLLLGSDM